jgi:4-amino-4-deoxy-L-arabinose transferase-like glycosyltransferase
VSYQSGTWVRRRRQLAAAAGWIVSTWVVLFWQLGFSSFWDPDEAHYAESTREMLAAREWLAPLYNGQPFFDKPVLFHALQMASFTVLGPTELAARLVPALSAVALLLTIWWVGRALFDVNVGRVAALMFLVLPATFALTRYAILDMTFTLFLFASAGCITVAALQARPRLQYLGYVLLGLAILTKGPLALVLAGLSMLLALVAVPAVRPALLGLRWVRGLAIAVGIAVPWFAYMWLRFGDAFTLGYGLRENLWLYTRPLYGNQPSYFFYPRTMVIALLPWSGLAIGRLFDVARGAKMDVGERLLWCWTIAILAFFSFSRFKLDHYIFPAAPALCLLCARAWADARADAHSIGARVGIRTIGLLLVIAGIAVWLLLDRVPLTFSPGILALPIVLIAGGLATIVRVALARPGLPSAPSWPIATLVGAYAVLILVALPAFEDAKPIGRLARTTAAQAADKDAIGMFRLNRWSGSWRYYVNRHTVHLETTDDVVEFFAKAGRHYCVMPHAAFEELLGQGIPVRVLYEQEGLFTTTGRNLRAGARARRERFVVVTEDDTAELGETPSPAM